MSIDSHCLSPPSDRHVWKFLTHSPIQAGVLIQPGSRRSVPSCRKENPAGVIWFT